MTVDYPPNTKMAYGSLIGSTVIVNCPHCGQKHYHSLSDVKKSYVKTHCKKGIFALKANYYQINLWRSK